ncbi:gas vesicle protein GvpG [Streptomyces sp. NPDC002055]|uniref:gas vesicle protein GvpG n=1 Tax=Streptomyces sp. NPDC002055 TaxID=3154534 RepID=UPI0033223BBA
MGLFTELLLLPLAPVRGVLWVTEQMAEAADQELRDPGVVRARLVALNEALEAGEIGVEEFEREEEKLLDLLEQRQAAPRAYVN